MRSWKDHHKASQIGSSVQNCTLDYPYPLGPVSQPGSVPVESQKVVLGNCQAIRVLGFEFRSDLIEKIISVDHLLHVRVNDKENARGQCYH